MIDVLDTYFRYIKQQMTNNAAQVSINGVLTNQPMGQVINARDWPLTPPLEGALYLLFLSATRIGGTEMQSLYEYVCQWSWYLIGQDIQPTQQTSNRGDRYRSNLQITENLRQANFPSFTQKNSFAVNNAGALTATPVTNAVPGSYTSVEMVWWTRPKFVNHPDNNKSGLLYGVAPITIFGYDDALASYAA